jgi:hypothetical protein
MTLFIALTLGPGCMFFLYALFQFWREVHRPGAPRLRLTKGAVVFLRTPAINSRVDSVPAASRTLRFQRRHSTERGVA